MGPGEYVADATQGITDPSELPKPIIEHRSRNYRRRRCPECGRSCYRDSRGRRTLHDLGTVRSGRLRDIRIVYSKHRCENCNIYFNADISDLALPGSHYTHRVVATAVRAVVEDGLPYRAASWHMWRDHRVFVPFATIQNWVEAAGKKGIRTRQA
jgi:hypothetical protein